MRDSGVTALRNCSCATGLFAPGETTRPLAFHAAAEAFRGHIAGVPLITAVAEVVDAAEVHQLFKTELVAQRAAGVVPEDGRNLEGYFATRSGDVDRGIGEARTQAFGEGGD